MHGLIQSVTSSPADITIQNFLPTAHPNRRDTRKPNRDKKRLWHRNRRENADFEVERRDSIRKPIGQNPAWRGDFRQKKRARRLSEPLWAGVY